MELVAWSVVHGRSLPVRDSTCAIAEMNFVPCRVVSQVRKDKKFRLGVASFREECSNYVEIIQCELRAVRGWPEEA